MLKNDLLIKALKNEKISRTPVWLMRQAGRYLPEYQNTRKKAGGFLDLCKNPDLACEVTLQPLRRYNLDAAILFSDILTIPDAMELGLSFEHGEGPVFAKAINSPDKVSQLKPPPKGSLDYVYQAVKTIKNSLNDQLPLIGFAGSPWTLATYMIEGKSSKNHHISKSFAINYPDETHQLLSLLTSIIIDYLSNQIDFGVDVVMLFDTWGGVLPYAYYPIFSLQYLQKIAEQLKQSYPQTPIIFFTKNSSPWLDLLGKTLADGIGIDWTVSLKTARKILGENYTIQGNLDPSILRTNPKNIIQETKNALRDYGKGHRHIFNLGHGITPDIPPDNVKLLIDTVAEFSPFYHQ